MNIDPTEKDTARAGHSGLIDIEVIGSINRKINSEMKLAELLSSIMDTAKYILNSEGSSILLTDPATGDLIFNIVAGEKGEIIKGQRVPNGKGIAGQSSILKKSVIVNDVQNDPRFFKGIDQQTDFKTINLLAVPMIVRDSVVGVLEIVNSFNSEGFNDRDLLKAQYVAGQAAIAITNRQLLDDLNKRIEELSSLFEIAQSISLTSRDHGILDRIADTMSRTLGIERISVVLYSDDDSFLRLAACTGLPLSVKKGMVIDSACSISGLVFRSGDPLISADITTDIPAELCRSGSVYKTKSFLSVPIIYQEKTLGVLNLSEKKNGAPFEGSDLRLAISVSGQMAEVYQNYLNQAEIENRKRLEQEIDIAAGIQRKILPVIPSIYAGHSLAAYNRPAKAVGGDFYDFIKFSENKYALVMADISGKGIPAALFMGSARNIVRAQTRINPAASALLDCSNRLIYEDSEFGMFVTLFYAVIDSHNRILTYGSAGHNNQLLIRARTKEVIKLKGYGKPLGIITETKFEERVLFFEDGDILLLFTDGVVECLGDDEMDIEIGERKLAEIAIENINSDPADIVEFVKKYAIKNPLDEDIRDDFTILAVKFGKR